MKAIVCPKYGPQEVLQLKEVEKPVPKNNELLIKIFTVVVGIEDPMQRKGKPYFARVFVGLIKPKRPILGTEFCGEIEEVGKDVKLYKNGDMIIGVTGAGFGCYAEYMCMPEAGLLSIKPPELTNEEAAPVCGALAAWNLLKAIANILFGKEFNLRNNKLLGLNGRFNYIGGDRISPVLMAKSLQDETVYYDETKAFEIQNPATKYLDFTLTYRTNKKRYSGVWALQVKNVLGTMNYEGYAFYYKSRTIENRGYAVILPVFSYKIEF